jgi:putative restriction endonuclease
VRGKRYELADLVPEHPVAQATWRYIGQPVSPVDLGPVDFASANTRGDPRAIVPRVGQQAFKALISDAYHHRCALTGEKVRARSRSRAHCSSGQRR